MNPITLNPTVTYKTQSFFRVHELEETKNIITSLYISGDVLRLISDIIFELRDCPKILGGITALVRTEIILAAKYNLID
jgi:hypothetical protein